MNRCEKNIQAKLKLLFVEATLVLGVFSNSFNVFAEKTSAKPSKNAVCATLLALMTEPRRYQHRLKVTQDPRALKIELEAAAQAAEAFRDGATESTWSDRRALNSLVAHLKAASADPEVQSGKRSSGIVSISVSGRDEIAQFLDFFEGTTKSIQEDEQSGKNDQVFYAKLLSTWTVAPVALLGIIAHKSHSFANFLAHFDGSPHTRLRLMFLGVTTLMGAVASTALVKGFLLNKDSGFQPALANIRVNLANPNEARPVYHHVEGRIDYSQTYLSPAIEAHVKDELISQLVRPFGFRLPFTNFYYQDLKFDMAYSPGTSDHPEPTLTMWLIRK